MMPSFFAQRNDSRSVRLSKRLPQQPILQSESAWTEPGAPFPSQASRQPRAWLNQNAWGSSSAELVRQTDSEDEMSGLEGSTGGTGQALIFDSDTELEAPGQTSGYAPVSLPSSSANEAGHAENRGSRRARYVSLTIGLIAFLGIATFSSTRKTFAGEEASDIEDLVAKVLIPAQPS